MMAFEERWMQALPLDEKVAVVAPYLTQLGLLSPVLSSEENVRLRAVVVAAGDRLKVAGDIVNYSEFFEDDSAFTYDLKAFSTRLQGEGSAERLLAFRKALEALVKFDAETIEVGLHDFVATNDIKIGAIIHAVRIAVTGKAVGFGLFEGMALLGRDACLARIDRALALANNEDTP